jgi:hypothetical protein
MVPLFQLNLPKKRKTHFARKTIGTQLFCNEVSVPSKQSERSSILPHITMFDFEIVPTV